MKGRRVARLSTATDTQIVKMAMASLVYLRDGEDKLRENVADRNIAVDVEELVRSGSFYSHVGEEQFNCSVVACCVD